LSRRRTEHTAAAGYSQGDPVRRRRLAPPLSAIALRPAGFWRRLIALCGRADLLVLLYLLNMAPRLMNQAIQTSVFDARGHGLRKR